MSKKIHSPVQEEAFDDLLPAITAIGEKFDLRPSEMQAPVMMALANLIVLSAAAGAKDKQEDHVRVQGVKFLRLLEIVADRAMPRMRTAMEDHASRQMKEKIDEIFRSG